MNEKQIKNKTVLLTGIKPTGSLHLGNYLGAIKPYLLSLEKIKKNQLSVQKKNLNKKDTNQKNIIYKDFKSPWISFFFIADYHSLTETSNWISFSGKKNSKSKDQALKIWSYEILASLLALNLNLEETIIYRQSDVPEIFELSWILSCFTPKGLINRTHAYKAKLDLNRKASKKDLDSGINMGLYSYPILMSSDILLFHTDFVPVGKDQVQHVEIARDIAQKFNHSMGQTLSLPTFLLNDESSWIPGLDGNKMSKSSQNTIPIFCSSKRLKKLISKIKTDSSLLGEPKDPSCSSLFQLYSQFASEKEIQDLKTKYEKGISWSEVKEMLFECIETFIKKPRENYNALIENFDHLENIFQEGAKRARKAAIPSLNIIREVLGLSK